MAKSAMLHMTGRETLIDNFVVGKITQEQFETDLLRFSRDHDFYNDRDQAVEMRAEYLERVTKIAGECDGKRMCRNCTNWTRQNPDDLTAPEGQCGLPENPGHWPTGYWPKTLMRDGCGGGFTEAEASHD